MGRAPGYLTPTSGAPLPQQPQSAVYAIRLFMSVIPALLLFVAVLFAWRYALSREKHRALLAQLELNN